MGTSLLYLDANNRAYLGRTLELSLELSYQVALFSKGLELSSADLKVVEGLNDAGLSFSVRSYSQAGGPQKSLDTTRAAVSAADLGTFLLGQYTSVTEVKAAMSDLQVVLERVLIRGGLEMPFHYAVHDAASASLVIEFHHGAADSINA